MTATDPTLYTHPNIRDIPLHVLQERAEQRRNRRLLAAVETNQLKRDKLSRLSGKDLEKFTKLTERAEKMLDDVRDKLDKVDDLLREARRLDGSITLIQQELGD
jgi:hypothetical protein